MVRLVYRGLSELRGSKDIGLIILTDEAQTRQIAVVCDKHIVNQFRIRMVHEVSTARLLPEVMAKMLKEDTPNAYHLAIDAIDNGVYRAKIVNEQTLASTDIRVSDGILMSRIADYPIYMEDALFDRQSVPFTPKATGMALPINAISEDMLQDALQKAIEREDYEMANQLNRELKRRKTETD